MCRLSKGAARSIRCLASMARAEPIHCLADFEVDWMVGHPRPFSNSACGMTLTLVASRLDLSHKRGRGVR
jgi:hypothetical protein